MRLSAAFLRFSEDAPACSRPSLAESTAAPHRRLALTGRGEYPGRLHPVHPRGRLAAAQPTTTTTAPLLRLAPLGPSTFDTMWASRRCQRRVRCPEPARAGQTAVRHALPGDGREDGQIRSVGGRITPRRPRRRARRLQAADSCGTPLLRRGPSRGRSLPPRAGAGDERLHGTQWRGRALDEPGFGSSNTRRHRPRGTS